MPKNVSGGVKKTAGSRTFSSRYQDRTSDRIMFDRMLFCVFGVILLIFLAVICHILSADSDYKAVLDTVSSSPGETLCETVPSVVQPDDSFILSTLTFGGTCTPASMLGSSSYGTFNLAYNENGGSFFLGEISGILNTDNGSVVGCSAVFSDRTDLVTAEKSETEWFLAPSSAADVFSLGGVDAVSLECPRSRDYGEAGLEETKNALSAQSLNWGDGEKDICFTLADGVRAVVCCAQYYEGCEESVAALIASAAQEYDLVLLYITDTDASYTVSDAKTAAYRAFADAGADAVIGTNASCLQRIEKWNGKTIAYSLGALIEGGTKYPEKYAVLLKLNIRIDEGSVAQVDCEVIPLVTYDDSHSWRPSVIADDEEKDRILSFMSGDLDKPGT